MSIEEDAARKKIAELLDADKIRPDVLQLCRFHNLMYHGEM